MKLKSIILGALISLGSLATFAAVPTVAEVESTIASGDYTKAKTQLKEVIAKNPDSIVANKYMLEVLSIEYAGSLKPSVEYKLYEANLNKALADKAEKAYQKALAEQAKAERERKQKFWKGVRTAISIVVVIALIFFFCMFAVPKIKQRQAEIKLKKELEVWKSKATEDMVHINSVLSTYLEDSQGSTYVSTYRLATLLKEDNLEALDAIKNNDYNRLTIERHIRDAYGFFDTHGIEQ